MRISFQAFLGKEHSWSKVQHELAREFIKRSHNVELQSTNGLEFFPQDLLPNLKQLSGQYDMQISYTAPKNWPGYLPISRSIKNRFGIWCTEFTELTPGFARFHIYVDKILAPSTFSKQTYLDAKVPESKVVVVPHGVNKKDFENLGKINLKTKKTFKLCAAISQPHARKNIEGTLEAYCKAFNKTDDICFVLKVSTKPITDRWEVDVFEIIKRINKKYPNHAEIELIKNYIPNINDLYNSCDAIFLLTHGEGFGLPYLEAMAADKLVIAPKSGGQLEFLNDDNALLVESKIVRAPMSAQYWYPSPTAGWFDSNIDSAVAQLRNAYMNHESIRAKTKAAREATIEKFSWGNAINIIESLIQ